MKDRRDIRKVYSSTDSDSDTTSRNEGKRRSPRKGEMPPNNLTTRSPIRSLEEEDSKTMSENAAIAETEESPAQPAKVDIIDRIYSDSEEEREYQERRRRNTEYMEQAEREFMELEMKKKLEEEQKTKEDRSIVRDVKTSNPPSELNKLDLKTKKQSSSIDLTETKKESNNTTLSQPNKEYSAIEALVKLASSNNEGYIYITSLICAKKAKIYECIF